MVFSRFFKKADQAALGDEADRADLPNPEDELAPEEMVEPSLAERAAARMPGAASTGSKRADALYGDADVDAPAGPTHFIRADGCRIETDARETLVDCTMALGAVAIGYADPAVTRAVMEAAGAGNVSGLSHALEVDVAERFCEVVPCAEKVQFLKSGAEAVSAAVRIARTHTGREVVIGCGYFGWHDWSSDAAGVPAAVRGNYRTVPFDDIAALERAVTDAGKTLAAIVIEPVVERLPSTEWIARARALCDAAGAVLVFDEVKTGFRLATGGYQQYADIVPDLAAFGKALANGFPLAAVCGRADVMDAARKTWISSTLAGESTALAAAYVVLELHRESDVCADLARIGSEMRLAVQAALDASGAGGVALEGLDPMWFLRFESTRDETTFLRTAASEGVLFKRGAYNFASLAHDEEAMHAIEGAASAGFIAIREAGAQS